MHKYISIKLLYTSRNEASANIAKWVRKIGIPKTSATIDIIEVDVPSVLEIEPDTIGCGEGDIVVILSPHKSKNPGKTLTAHYPGNWNSADFGGQPKTLNATPAKLMKLTLSELDKEARKIGWEMEMEADHHGPTCRSPIIFVEIGNGEEQWKDEEGAKALATALTNALVQLDTKQPDKYYKTFVGVGGGHYPKLFKKLALESDLAPGHILPKYSIDKVDIEIFRQAIIKSVERVELVIIAKDETNTMQKERIRRMCDEIGVGYELM